MDLQLFANNAVTLLQNNISGIDTSLTVKPGTGILFPDIVDSGDYFLVTLENPQASLREIIRVTARSGDVFTIERAQEGMVALPWNVNTIVDCRITAATLVSLQNGGGGGGGGSGDVTSAASSSVDGEITLFSGTTGKVVKRATGNGVVKVTSGVMSTVTLPMDSAKFLDGEGNFTTPSGTGSGDVSSVETLSIDNELPLFSGITGKIIKKATGSGIPKLTSGVLSTITLPMDSTKFLDGDGNFSTPINNDCTGSSTILGLTSDIVDVIDTSTQKYSKWIVLVTTASGMSSFEVLALFGATIEYVVTAELGDAGSDFSFDLSYDIGIPTNANLVVTNLIGTSIVAQFTRFYSIVETGSGTALIGASSTEIVEVVDSNLKKTAKWMIVVESGSLMSGFELTALFGATLEYFIDSELGDAFGDFSVSVDYDIGVPTDVNISITNLTGSVITVTFVRI